MIDFLVILMARFISLARAKQGTKGKKNPNVPKGGSPLIILNQRP